LTLATSLWFQRRFDDWNIGSCPAVDKAQGLRTAMRSQHGSGQIWVEGGHQARKRSKAQTAVVQYWEHVSPPDVRSRSSQRVVQIGGLQGNIVPCTARCRPATLVCSRPQLIPMIWRSASEPGVARVGDADSFINIRKCGNVCQRRSKSRPVWRSKTRPGSGATMPAAKIPARYRQRSGVVVGLMRPRSTMNCAPLPRYRHRV
jgi:hypothetical protein